MNTKQIHMSSVVILSISVYCYCRQCRYCREYFFSQMPARCVMMTYCDLMLHLPQLSVVGDGVEPLADLRDAAQVPLGEVRQNTQQHLVGQLILQVLRYVAHVDALRQRPMYKDTCELFNSAAGTVGRGRQWAKNITRGRISTREGPRKKKIACGSYIMAKKWWILQHNVCFLVLIAWIPLNINAVICDTMREQ